MELLSSLVIGFARGTWSLTSEMAPYLLLGFLMAGILRAFFTEEWVRRHLGQRGIRQIFKSVIIGIPLPLCSCGVIPVAAGIRKQGGQRGAVAAFTASTPQTGVDSIAATVGMMGWVFAIVRIVIAFVNGIVAGLVVERWGGKDPVENPAVPQTTGADPKKDRTCTCGLNEGGPCECPEEEEKEAHSSCCSSKPEAPADSFASKLGSGLQFGLVTLPRDLFGALVLGLLVAGAIAVFAPADLFSSLPGGRFTLYVTMTLISLPLYVCSTGSIPMAFSFLQAGMSPGAVLIFLIAGPASNAATVTSLWKIIGGKSTLGYILSIICTCWLMAIVIDFSGISLLVTEAMHHHETGISLFQHLSAVALVALLGFAKLNK